MLPGSGNRPRYDAQAYENANAGINMRRPTEYMADRVNAGSQGYSQVLFHPSNAREHQQVFPHQQPQLQNPQQQLFQGEEPARQCGVFKRNSTTDSCRSTA